MWTFLTTTEAEFVSWLGPWTSDGTPLHTQLSAGLRSLIVSGQLDVDSKLPAERNLGRMLHVSRNTVTAAYRTLIDEGWVETKRGSGAKVANGPHARNRTHQVSATFSGLLARSKSLDEGVADLTVRSPISWPGIGETWAKVGAANAPWLDQDGYSPAGDARFLQRLAEHLTAQGLPTTSDELLITTGAQQGLNLVSQLLLSKGDRVVTQTHTYPGALDAFMAAGAHVVAPATPRLGPSETASPRPSETHTHTQRQRRPSLYYVISANQNPTGGSMSTSQRVALANKTSGDGAYVLDDLSMADLGRLTGSVLEPMDRHIPNDRLITIGSFSKLFWTGLRLGWIRADHHLIDRLIAMKTTADLGASIPSQALGFHLLDHFDEALVWRAEHLTAARQIVKSAITEHAPNWRFEPTQSGMYFWIELPHDVALAFTQFALRYNVVFVPGQLFHPEGLGNRFIRVSLATPPDQLKLGMQRLVEAWDAFATTA